MGVAPKLRLLCALSVCASGGCESTEGAGGDAIARDSGATADAAGELASDAAGGSDTAADAAFDPDTGPVSDSSADAGAPPDPDPTLRSRLTGTHHITEFFGEQALLDQTGAGAIRINIGGVYYRDHARGQERWEELDPVVQGNGDKQLFVTVYARHNRLSATTTPKIPETEAEIADFVAWTRALGRRYREQVDYWQLENEVVLPSHWPVDRYGDYVRLLLRFHDALRAEGVEAPVVLAGFVGGASPTGVRVRELLTALAAEAPGAAQAIDIHHHQAWDQGAALAARIEAFRAALASDYPAIGPLAVVVTENSTWMDDPENKPPQSALEQAVYVVESIYAALGAGAEFCIFGTLLDRLLWQGEARLHHFNLNGLFYHPDKAYTDGPQQGPKPAAFSLRLVATLLAEAGSDVVQTVDTGTPGLWRVDVGGSRPHIVVWWQGNGPTQISLESPWPGQSVKVVTPISESGQPWSSDDPVADFPTETLAVGAAELSLELAPHRPRILMP